MKKVRVKQEQEHVVIAFIRRKTKEYGVAHVAKAAGISRQTVYRVLEKGSSPGLCTMVRIVNGLGYCLHISKIEAHR